MCALVMLLSVHVLYTVEPYNSSCRHPFNSNICASQTVSDICRDQKLISYVKLSLLRRTTDIFLCPTSQIPM